MGQPGGGLCADGTAPAVAVLVSTDEHARDEGVERRSGRRAGGGECGNDAGMLGEISAPCRAART